MPPGSFFVGSGAYSIGLLHVHLPRVEIQVWVNSAGGVAAILAVATTLETCLERSCPRAFADKLLHSKQRRECNSFTTTALHPMIP